MKKEQKTYKEVEYTISLKNCFWCPGWSRLLFWESGTPKVHKVYLKKSPKPFSYPLPEPTPN